MYVNRFNTINQQNITLFKVFFGKQFIKHKLKHLDLYSLQNTKIQIKTS